MCLCAQVLGVCRTEHMSPYLISVVVQEQRGVTPQSKKLCYLVDLQVCLWLPDSAASVPVAM